MNKIEYQKPMAQFVQFSNEDVVTTSGCGQNGNGNMSCIFEAQANKDDECFVLGYKCFWGLFKGAANDDCILGHKVGCEKDSIMDACKEASKAGQTWDCTNNWTNFYSEP